MRYIRTRNPIPYFLAGVLFLSIHPTQAAIIDASLTDLGWDLYRWDYSVINDGSLPGGADLESFDLAFPTASITGVSDLAAWDEWQPSIDLLVMDAFPGPGLGVSEVLDFWVTFQWLGSGIPGAQAYTVYDFDTFAVLETGTTRVQSLPVQEPGALWLTAIGTLGLLGLWRRNVRTACIEEDA